MKATFIAIFAGVFLVIFSLAGSRSSGAESAVTLSALLDEMIDRDAAARFPNSVYSCRQSSSYDRRSVDPADEQGWFTNNDYCQFVRQEEHDGRTEYVLHDTAGPGCIVRFWLTEVGPLETIRVYIDGAEEPVLEEKAERLLSGKGPIGEPFSALRSRGYNLYLPIPYSKRCVITHDNPFLYYNLNYRTYPSGTNVESFSRETLAAAMEKIDSTGRILLDQEASKTSPATVNEPPVKTLAKGGAEVIELTGPSAVRALTVKLEAADLSAALRSTILVMRCDGEDTIWCPVGDFFGSGVGANAYRDWGNHVEEDGTMTCHWVMPFAKAARIELKNVGDQDVKVHLRIATSPWKWDDRSMHFHANWRLESPVDSTKFCDWNYVEITGRGRFVGDTLAIYNPLLSWWGEGDEKIYVDGEKFPSHFGTGTEDYYGYAYCSPKLFCAPFHAQPRVDGPRNFGHTTNTRLRLLDDIPFEKTFRMDMEVWHGFPGVPMTYAAATYWYAMPGARTNRTPQPESARVVTQSARPPFKLDGVIEGEDLKAFEKPKGGRLFVQSDALRPWSGGKRLAWGDLQPNDVLNLKLPIETAGKFNVILGFSASDNIVVQLYLDDKPIGKELNAYRINRAINIAISLGGHELTAGMHKLTVKVVGHEPMVLRGQNVGLDYIKVEPIGKP